MDAPGVVTLAFDLKRVVKGGGRPRILKPRRGKAEKKRSKHHPFKCVMLKLPGGPPKSTTPRHNENHKLKGRIARGERENFGVFRWSNDRVMVSLVRAV